VVPFLAPSLGLCAVLARSGAGVGPVLQHTMVLLELCCHEDVEVAAAAADCVVSAAEADAVVAARWLFAGQGLVNLVAALCPEADGGAAPEVALPLLRACLVAGEVFSGSVGCLRRAATALPRRDA
jgi:hypothetical protein